MMTKINRCFVEPTLGQRFNPYRVALSRFFIAVLTATPWGCREELHTLTVENKVKIYVNVCIHTHTYTYTYITFFMYTDLDVVMF